MEHISWWAQNIKGGPGSGRHATGNKLTSDAEKASAKAKARPTQENHSAASQAHSDAASYRRYHGEHQLADSHRYRAIGHLMESEKLSKGSK